MTSEAVEEAKANPSSVASSEASSKHSLCCGEDAEVVFNTRSSGLSARRQKSSSLSCLPDRIFILDENCSTLPSKLSSVKPFEEDLRQGVSTATCYDTAESLSSTSAESLHDDANIGKLEKISPDNHPGENEGSLQENTNTSGQQQEVKGFEEELERKKDIDLSELNTETRTFVRSSALDILAAFPKTETVVEGNSVRIRSPENTVHHTGSLNVLSEEPCEQADNSPAVSRTEHAQPNPAKSEPVLAGSQSAACDEQPEGTTWGSTSEVDPKVKKKRLFQKGKKKKTVISKNLNVQDSMDGKRSSSDDSENKQNSGAASQRRPRGKKAKKKSSSSAWRDFFRGKSESREESAKQEKPRKARKPVQKSQSFHSGTTTSSRNAQLNRMDSFRKLFKRPRDSIAGSTVLGDGKNTENIKCLEISSPILKSEFRSNKLVDRDVFIAQRDRAYQLDKEKLKKDKKQGEDPQLGVVDRLPRTPNGIVEEERTKIALNRCDDSRLMPVAPVRWKHLERKRQSLLAEEGNGEAIEATSCVQNGDDSEPHGGNLDDLVLNESTAHNEDVKQTNSGLNAVVSKPLSSPDQEVRKPTEEKALDNNGNETHPFNRLTPHDSSITHDLSFPGKPYVDESSLVQSPPGFDIGGCEEEFEDVFQECSDDQKLSFDSSAGTAQVERMPVESTIVKRWHSDVTSDASKKAIGVVKKSATFCEGNSSGSTSEMSSAGTSSNEDRPQRRSLSIFTRIPTVKLEQPDQPTMVTDLVPTSFPLFLTDRRSQIILELFTTERTYVRGLETMIELFKKPLLSGRVDEKEVDALFSNINEIFAVNKDLLFLLWEKVKHWSSEQCIGHLFTDMEDRFKIYAIYCKNFDRADAMYKQKIKRNKDFDRFLKACYQDPLCQPGLDLPAYLITVVQRIPRYLLLLKDLCKKTPASHPDYDNLKQALSRMNKVAEYINSQLQEVHGQKAMQELRSTVIGLKAYEVKGRTLLKEAEVCLMSPKKPYKCLLFNDIMVFAVQGSKDRSEIEMTLELRTLWFEDLRNQDPQTNKCDAIELYTPRRPYTMYACSRTEKRVWLQKLRTAIVTLLYGPDCEDPDGMDISRRKASDTYIDGSVYCGEYLNGKRHGEGVMAWPNRTRYEGSWADDERHGHGQLTYYTKEKYVGSWVADKKDGRGRQTYVNGDVYDGEWSEGKMHGKGVIEFGNGDRFVGDMLNNEVEGHGEMTCVSGMLYKGEWKTSKRHGQGHVFFPNGNEYKGEFLNDRICGYGQMNYFNGDAYVGEWVNEMRHGIGYFKLVQGDVYDGQWNNDFMNGQGKMSYSNGDEYTGTWYQNKRFGKGQMIFAYGDTYNGQWQDDTMHGKGVMYYKDGSVYDGFWERGERHGHGKTVYCDNSVYEGEYFNGFRQGRGKHIFANNVCYVGEWKADKFDGNGVFSDPNTEYSYQGDWSCGKREGTGIEISYRTRYEGGWKADMKHGTGIEKSHAGHTFEGTWKENKKHGRGVRTLRSNVREEQNWYEGHLADMAETVAEDLPPLPRR